VGSRLCLHYIVCDVQVCKYAKTMTPAPTSNADFLLRLSAELKQASGDAPARLELSDDGLQVRYTVSNIARTLNPGFLEHNLGSAEDALAAIIYDDRHGCPEACECTVVPADIRCSCYMWLVVTMGIAVVGVRMWLKTVIVVACAITCHLSSVPQQQCKQYIFQADTRCTVCWCSRILVQVHAGKQCTRCSCRPLATSKTCLRWRLAPLQSALCAWPRSWRAPHPALRRWQPACNLTLANTRLQMGMQVVAASGSGPAVRKAMLWLLSLLHRKHHGTQSLLNNLQMRSPTQL
jgi:hypothetical protein